MYSDDRPCWTQRQGTPCLIFHLPVRACCAFLARSYTAVVSACGRAGQWQKAAQYLDEMEAEGTEVR